MPHVSILADLSIACQWDPPIDTAPRLIWIMKMWDPGPAPLPPYDGLLLPTDCVADLYWSWPMEIMGDMCVHNFFESVRWMP